MINPRALANARAEDVRRCRWHATYNAAVTGMLAHTGNFREHCAEKIVKRATEIADATHGKLLPE